MDLGTYFRDLKVNEAALMASRRGKDGHVENVVHVTSLFHRERNSTAGTTIGATIANAARVITDGTHREATPDEIAAFRAHQQDELERSTVAEQLKKKQYIVVVDQKDSAESAVFRTKQQQKEQQQPATSAK